LFRRPALTPLFPFRETLVTFVTAPFIFPLHSTLTIPYAGVIMCSQPLIIRTCRHILPDGRRCRGAAVRQRACCRHHLNAQARLHNMARARRRTCIPRLRVPMTSRDLALNHAEVRRVLATGRIDFDTARVMMWGLRLAAATFPAKLRYQCARSHNSTVFYQVPTSPLFAESCHQIPVEVIENTVEEERLYALLDAIGREV